MPESNLRVCPVCKVQILPGGMAGDKVLFSVGPPGTRATLWARVCQFTQKAGCINQDRTSVGEIKPTDYYQPDP